jgi:hypothetical protein
MENNENKPSSKNYLIGAIVLIVAIVIIVLLVGKSKPAEQNLQAPNTANVSEVNTAAVESATPAQSISQGFIGTWVSASQGKGLEGFGKVTTPRTSTEITAHSDVKLVIQKIENGMAIGTLSYSNLCYTIATSISGRAAVAKPEQCTNTPEVAARLQVDGNKISYQGQTELSSDVSFEGNLSGDTLTGTFVRTGTYGEVTGTLKLVRAKN